jgi:hypothetical protein
MGEQNEFPILTKFRNNIYSKKCQNTRTQTKTKLRGFGPRENYADRATAACWRSSANFCG